MGSVTLKPPFDAGTTFSAMYGAIEVPHNTPVPSIGYVGTSIAMVSTAGSGYRETGVGAFLNRFPTSSSGYYLITVLADVWFRGEYWAFFTGYGKTTTALRLQAVLQGKRSRSNRVHNDLDIFSFEGPVGFSFPALEWRPRQVSIIVKPSRLDSVFILANAIQSVIAIGGGMNIVSNLGILVKQIEVTGIAQGVLPAPWF